MMWWNHGGWGADDWLAMSLMMVVFWGVLIALVVGLVRISRERTAPRSTGHQGQARGADEVLAERFARGEIDEAEFSRSRAILHATSSRS